MLEPTRDFKPVDGKHPLFENLLGRRFGRLIVVQLLGRFAGRTWWLCECDCGNQRQVPRTNLVKGNSKSCGCISTKMLVNFNRTHGGRGLPEYNIWCKMRARCQNPDDKGYPSYGGRGITVDPSWNNFATFSADMGPRPSRLHSIERKNNNLGYSASNCVWATKKEQARNTRRNRHLTVNGETKLLCEWSALTGIDSSLISARIKKLGWSVERAVLTPIRRGRKTLLNHTSESGLKASHLAQDCEQTEKGVWLP